MLPQYSIGVGDRFAHQARAQLEACIQAAKAGVQVAPVWNKSNREHNIIGSSPDGTRNAADEAVKALHWDQPYFVDADHINLSTAERFIGPSDFFTIDVADLIGQAADLALVKAFVEKHTELARDLHVAGIAKPLHSDADSLAKTAGKYLAAVAEAGKIYRGIEPKKGRGNFVAEVSMDETDSPQTPIELLIILVAIADEKIPIQTIAPKFTGRFNKGVDYVGDLEQFATEFSDDIAAIAFAVQSYGLPKNLKLSVHSGSDKFSIYPAIHRALKQTGAGLHLKTAGTTWLEELIGLAEAGGEGLQLAKQIYAEAYAHRSELCAPYAAVIDIDPDKLPQPAEVHSWTSEQFVRTLRHNQKDELYNSSLRQLLHVGFKVAAKLGGRYLNLLSTNEEIVAKNVTENLFVRHIRPIYLGN